MSRNTGAARVQDLRGGCGKSERGAGRVDARRGGRDTTPARRDRGGRDRGGSGQGRAGQGRFPVIFHAQMYIMVTFHRAGVGRGTMYKEARFQREVGVIKCIGSVDVSEVRAQMLGRARGSSTVGVGGVKRTGSHDLGHPM